jgi:glc operon protein GlcG
MKAIVTAAALMLGQILIAGSMPAQLTTKKSLSMEGANQVIAAAVAEARSRRTTGVIAVVDEGGNLMALSRIDGTFAAGANISIGKARTAVLFQKPTKVFEDIINKGRTAMTTVNDFTPLQGGVPIVIDGEVVGGVGVSGASSAQEDEQLAMAGASAVKKQAAVVSYFDRSQVEDAFAKGSVLFANSDKYMVHASRREKPGMVEIHEKDADIVHVLEGTATLVTGGESPDAKATEPGELRGSQLVGGQTRTLGKGDVVIVPAGTPHWFKEVSSPFLYYVVKAR